MTSGIGCSRPRSFRGSRHDRRGRSQERGARALRRAVLGARQPLPPPGWPARRGLDRERAAALPVARLRLLPARRQARPGSRTRRSPTRSRFVTARSTSGRGGPARPHRLRRDGARRWSAGASRTSSGWSATRTSGSRTRCAARRRRQADLHRDPARRRRRVRGVRLRQAHRPARRLPDDRRPGRDEPADRALGREGRPRAGARADRPGRHPGARPRRVPGGRPRRRVRRRRRWSQPVLRDSNPVELMNIACKNALLGATSRT